LAKANAEKSRKIVLMGHVAIDTIIDGISSVQRQELGGPAAYCSVALNSLKAEFQVYTKIGKDFPKEYFDFLTKFAGISLEKFVSAFQPTTRFRIDRSIEPRRMWLEAKCESLGLDLEKELKAVVDPEETILIADPIAGEISPEFLYTVSKHFRWVIADSQGFVRAFDPKTGRVSMKSPFDTSFLDRVDYLKGDAAEINALSGGSDFQESAREIGKRVAHLIITSGSGPVFLYEGSRLRYRARPHLTSEKDTTGAGDILLATFAASLAEDKCKKESLCFAVAAATCAVGIKGIRKAILDRASVEAAAGKIELVEY
jgi:sugar/nucleoside kinase (ribokinase family)